MSTEVECGKCHEVGTESVSYTDKMIRHKLVTGLEDKDILQDLLTANKEELEKMVAFVEGKESSKNGRKSLAGAQTGVI